MTKKATKKLLPHPRAARDAAGLSVIALAAKVPCSLMLVYRCEQDGCFPSRTAKRIAYMRALGLEVESTAAEAAL